MEFLRKVAPSINWKQNIITCKINNKIYNLPTCKLGVNDDNAFANLPVDDHEDSSGIELLPSHD
jgi:hypothetical protein